MHNLYIEGENLVVLRQLKEKFGCRVNVIYIDPPYNTGHDGLYRDRWEETEWRQMMKERLSAGRELLREDGVQFISIDHHELTALAEVCDEVFGRENRIGLVTVVNNLKGRSDDRFFATCNEFLLVYAKDRDQLQLKGFVLEDEELDADYGGEDNRGRYKLVPLKKSGKAWRREDRPGMFYPIVEKNGKLGTFGEAELKSLYDEKRQTFHDDCIEQLTADYEQQGYRVVWPRKKNGEWGRWRWGIKTFLSRKDTELEINKAGIVCTKMRALLENGGLRLKTAKTLWYKPEYDTGSAADSLGELMGDRDVFVNAKSVELLKDVLRISTDENSLVLDYFSGSATTAQAVVELNAEDGGSRRFVLVQEVVATPTNSVARKLGYQTICEIGEERIRRVGRILKDKNTGNEATDVEFQIIKM